VFGRSAEIHGLLVFLRKREVNKKVLKVPEIEQKVNLDLLKEL
jgi:hypothetical protein